MIKSGPDGSGAYQDSLRQSAARERCYVLREKVSGGLRLQS